MSTQKLKNLEPTDTFDEDPGIIQRFKAKYSNAEIADDDDDVNCKEKREDPVRQYQKESKLPQEESFMTLLQKKPKKEAISIDPSIGTRLQLDPYPLGQIGAKYNHPESHKMKWGKHEKRLEFFNITEFCDYEVVRLPSPVNVDDFKERIITKSPEVSKAKVIPERPSAYTSSMMVPPTSSYLKSHKMRSGIKMINDDDSEKEETSETLTEEEEEEQEPVKTKKKCKNIIKIRKKRKQSKFSKSAEAEHDVEQYLTSSAPEKTVLHKETNFSDDLILGKYGELISYASSATSMHDKDVTAYSDVSWCEIPLTSRLVQTLRDGLCEKKPKKKYKKGALENHSLTKLRQCILEDFPYHNVCGSIHQNDICFPKVSQGNQGICMPIAAFCYGHIKKPRDWSSKNIDEIVELGNNHYLQSIAELHLHKGRKILNVDEIDNYFFLDDKKIKFEISHPAVTGLVRSTNHRIYNLSAALKAFFLKFQAGILRTELQSYLLWKLKPCCFLFFDATPRKKNLYQDLDGFASMTLVRSLKALRSILLARSSIANLPFNISQIQILKIMAKDEREEDEYVKERNTYIALNERQAVLQGSFDLGDLCFMFNRNKQALSMAVIALAYSRISVPHCWHKRTLDKILTVGNQLHSLIVEADNCNGIDKDVGIEHLPALFTVGPYVIEIHIYPNIHVDLMFRKSNCMLLECLMKFFEANNNAVAQIGKSFLAIWQQRDMFFCFDPYTRNKEGLKCRRGTAAVTMNRDVKTLVETVVSNFDQRETIFHLHAVKLIRIHRDPQLTKIFPKNQALQDVPLDTFHRNKCQGSKKKATDKPFATADFKEKALKTLMAGVSAGASLYDVQSNVLSLGANMVPALECPKILKAPIRKEDAEDADVCDLDSPSLSDTQIIPKRPNPYDELQIDITDLAAFGLTIEEKELEEEPEGFEGTESLKGKSGEPAKRATVGGKAGGEDDDEDDADVTADEVRSQYGMYSQVTSGELDPCFAGHQVNTDLTYCYKILPALELPIRTKEDRDLVVDEANQLVEFSKMRNYKALNENIQILTSNFNALDCCADEDPNLVIPYICIMAAAYDLEKPINRWDQRILDFILKAGLILYKQYNESFLHIDDYRFELKKNNIFCTVDVIFHTYIGDGLFNSFSGQKVLEQFIDKHVFNDQNVGFVIVPHYSCVVFFRKDVFYLFDPYNCNGDGVVQHNNQKGFGCVMRFKSFDELIAKLVDNLSRRVSENDSSNLQFRMLLLAKPNFESTMKPKVDALGTPGEVGRFNDDVVLTISEEFKRPSNFVQLPDGSQLVRSQRHVGEIGPEIEYIAPYVCLISAAVAEKYSIRTWSSEILDFILQAGELLYKKSKYRFNQLTKLEIPMISLGSTDFKVQVRHLFEAPLQGKILKYTIERITSSERDWMIIITEIFSCCIVKKHGIYYLYDPFACNELGLHDLAQTSPPGSSVARFRNIEDAVNRILFNKKKQEVAEGVNYTKFSGAVCRASRLSKKMLKQLEEHQKQRAIKEAARAGENEDFIEEELAEEEEESEFGVKHVVPPSRNIHGYQKVTSAVEVLQGSKILQRPAANQLTLLEDYFACLCACLMVIHKPLELWDTKTVDQALDLGTHVFNHADNLEHARKRTIKNVLVGNYFFDVIVKLIEIEDSKYRRTFQLALNYVMRKRKFVLLCTGEGTYVIYLDTDNNLIHVFHPYVANFKSDKRKSDGKEEKTEETKACWIKFRTMKQMKRFLRQNNNLNRFKFYTFSVINVTKAPRSAIVSSMIQEWIKVKQMRGEALGKSFHEHESWMDLHNNPWARLKSRKEAANCLPTVDNKWYAWDIEYSNDLFSLVGTLNEFSKNFKELRGKQTLANLVVVIGMTGIYDLIEWNSSVVDAVMICGYKYMRKCVEAQSATTNDDGDGAKEFDLEDLLEDCEIFPYTFKVHSKPVLDGTMFIDSFKRYNLYRALRHFFDDYYYRAGIIVNDKNGIKKMVAFAKRKESEYYMFDSSTFGSPMFAPEEGLAYMLRCTTLARLVHVLTLTLRGGDFFIYEIVADQFAAIDGNPYSEEKPKLRP